MRTWRAVRAGVMVLAVIGLAMGGLALAQDPAATGGANPVPSAAFERILDLLAPLVDDGTLTEDQAAAVADRLADTLPSRRDRRAGARRDHVADVLVDQLGVAPTELRGAARAGASLAEVAEAEGIATDELVGRIVAPVEERLSDAVAEGDLTEDEAAARLDEAHSRVTDRVNEPIIDRRRARSRDG